MTQLVLVEDQDRIRIISMNRPEKRNALNEALHEALLAEFQRADTDAGVHCVVLAGAGKSFCAGADLAEHSASVALDAASAARRIERMADLQLAASRLGKPVVSAVHGTCVGAGAGLAVSADLVVMAHDATLAWPEVPHGMIPAFVFPVLASQLERRAAFELIFTGCTVNGERALALGLVNQLAAPAELLAQALAVAGRFTAMNVETLRTAKKHFARATALPLEEGMRNALELALAPYRAQAAV